MQTPVYNMEGKQAGTVDLPDSIFGLPWNGALVKQVVEAEAANLRSGTAHTKDRSEVAGGGKKPWRQKGTGRARHGSIRSPLWVGGGVTHGPRNSRRYDEKVNVRARRKALLVSLSGKARDGEIIVFDEIAFPEAKTRHAAQMFRSLAAAGVRNAGE
ncbi:MAG: 50S ribosomal protein L4, partial [Patescibacteria group bacterium]